MTAGDQAGFDPLLSGSDASNGRNATATGAGRAQAGPLPDVPLRLDSGSHDLVEDLFLPCLQWATEYRRAVGFFAAGWLRLNATGMASFAARGGQAWWLTSPVLDEADFEAIKAGTWRDSDFARALARDLERVKAGLSERTLNALAWMVADGVLEFRFAVPRGRLEGGDFHDKFGIFADPSGNRLSFNGSVNDSVQGMRNYESVKVFRTWRDGQEAWVDDDEVRFARLWAGEEEQLRIYDLPEGIRDEIFRLRTGDRPYTPPVGGGAATRPPRRPALPPDLFLRDYQAEAIRAWREAGNRGILAMATGSGKTFTSLAAATQLVLETGRLALVVVVPFQHLATQWEGDLQAFGWEPLLCFGGRTRWEQEAHIQASNYRIGVRHHVCLVAVNRTFSSEAFQAALRRIGGGAMLVADEVHYLGAQQLRDILPGQIEHRLGLSATPIRVFDDLGTSTLLEYFGGIVYEFDLRAAIAQGCLTPYYYYPHLVDLTDEEVEQYRLLSVRIARAWRASASPGNDDRLGALLRQRAQLITSASQKLDAFFNLVDDDPITEYSLVYVDHHQIDPIMRRLAERGLRAHRFTHDVPNHERQSLLERFRSKDIQILVAMKCLDEGVDVPPTRRAYVLASSSNPREFVQRRGRVLRRSPGKEHAEIHDFLVLPDTAGLDPDSLDTEKKIIKRELARFNEFADAALNTFSARDELLPALEAYGIWSTHMQREVNK